MAELRPWIFRPGKLRLGIFFPRNFRLRNVYLGNDLIIYYLINNWVFNAKANLEIYYERKELIER